MQKTTSPLFSNSMAAGAQSEDAFGMSWIGTPRNRNAFAVPGEPTSVKPNEANFAASSAKVAGEFIDKNTVFPSAACFFVGIFTQ